METPHHLPGNVSGNRYFIRMSRYRLLPTPAQEAALRDHCAHARYVWNLAVEQHTAWRPGRANAPGYLEQCRQLTKARAEYTWLAAGSQMVQQQALRDFAQATAAFFDPQNPAGRPSWRKAGRNEGFRIVGRGNQWDVRRLSRKVGQVWVPKAGWVRFRWSRAVPVGVKSYRVRMDRAGRWHLTFAAIPARSRESQARFVCTACGYACHADVNAAINIAAGHAVTARGGDGVTRPVNREPHLLAS